MYNAWQRQRRDRDDPEDDGSGEPRVASMMVKGKGKGRGQMDTSLKRRRGDDSIRRPLTSQRPDWLQEPLLSEGEEEEMDPGAPCPHEDEEANRELRRQERPPG